MPDQADRLRELARARHGVSHVAAGPPIVLVTGAQESVGTSTIARQLASCLNDMEITTAFFDTSAGRSEAANDSSAAAPTTAKQFIDRLQPAISQTKLVVVDGGIGIDVWTESLWRAAELALLVTTPEEHSFVRAYAQLKLARHDRITTPLHLTVNRAENPLVARAVHARIAETCRRFLGESVPASPPLPSDPTSPAWNAALGMLAQHVAKSLAMPYSAAA